MDFFFVCHDALFVPLLQPAKWWSCRTLSHKHYRNGELVEISIIVLCSGSGKDFVIWSTCWGTGFDVVLKKSLCNSCNLFLCMHYIMHWYNSDISYVWIAWEYADCNSMFICNKIFCAWRLHIKLLKLGKTLMGRLRQINTTTCMTRYFHCATLTLVHNCHLLHLQPVHCVNDSTTGAEVGDNLCQYFGEFWSWVI